MRRRHFIQWMATTAAAVLARPLDTIAAPARTPAAVPKPALSAATRREIATQKRSVAETLKAIRAYDLPPGSPPAYAFHAIRRSGSRGR